jgi:hypothetical protein
VRSAALLLLVASLARADSPEVALCATAMREGERARAESVLGPLERLPLYRAEIQIDPDARTAQGHLSIRYPARSAPLEKLYLRLTPNAFGDHRVSVKSVRAGGKPVDPEQVDAGLLRVKLPAPVAPGGSVEVELELEAHLPRAPLENGSPFQALSPSSTKTDHGAFQATDDFVSLVGLLPQVPPMEKGEPIAGPTGIGDLALYEPANYLVAVKVPKGWRALAIGNALGEVPGRDGTVRFSFGASAVRDYPLFAGRGFMKATQAIGDLTVESDFLPQDADSGHVALSHAVAAITELQRRLGPLPLRTVRVVEAPLRGGAGGMEFPGLLTVSQQLYRGGADLLAGMGLAMLPQLGALQGANAFLGSADFAPMMKQLFEFTIDHEVAHQYFAGLVGSDPIKDPVADESLAQYTALMLLEWRHGKGAADQVRDQQLVMSYQLYRMLGGRDGPADRPTSDFDNELEYAALVYGKAPLLHEAQRQLLGDAAYTQGLRAYVEKYRHGWACGDCLTRVLAEKNPAQAKALFALRRHWLAESHGDDDLGKSDLGSMVKQLTGQDLDPESAKMLEELMPQLFGK